MQVEILFVFVYKKITQIFVIAFNGFHDIASLS
jgi:hypothetical protein